MTEYNMLIRGVIIGNVLFNNRKGLQMYVNEF